MPFVTHNFAITIDDIRAAAKRIHSHIIRTPVVSVPLIDEAFGAEVFFKCENLQHVGAFKARGACNAVFSLSPQEAISGVVAHSSGNHAAALARAAKLRNIPAHIVMPRNSAAVKISAVRCLGVEPTFCEPNAESRQAAADQVMEDTGATFVHPYNNAAVIAGQGTAAIELLEQVPNLDLVIVPVGGGGLLSGTLIACRSHSPNLKVLAAEPMWADDAFRSLMSGQIESPTRYDTIADGLRTPLGSLTFPIIQHFVDEILLTSEDDIRLAAAQLIQYGKLVVEPSGAVPLAALSAAAREDSERFRGKRIGIIISGGNADPETLRDLISDTGLNTV